MKRALIFMVLIALVLSGCGKADPKSNAQAAPEKWTAPKQKYYGTWQVEAVLTSDFAKPVDANKAKPFIGRVFELSENQAKFDQNILQKPAYDVNVSLKSTLENDKGVSGEVLGLNKAQELTIVTIIEKGKPWNSPGATFIMAEGANPIIYHEGIFYKTKATGNTKSLENIAEEKEAQKNVFDKKTIQQNAVVVGLTVAEVVRDENITESVLFSGAINLTGQYEWVGDLLIFSCDDESLLKVPVFQDYEGTNSIILNGVGDLKTMFPEAAGKAVIQIDNYSIGERELIQQADIIVAETIKPQ